MNTPCSARPFLWRRHYETHGILCQRSQQLVEEIQVRFGRDDKLVTGWDHSFQVTVAVGITASVSFSHKFVVSTGAKRSGETCGSFAVLTQSLKPSFQKG